MVAGGVEALHLEIIVEHVLDIDTSLLCRYLVEAMDVDELFEVDVV